MKKMLMVALALTGCLLTACSTEIPLDDADTEVVAEYVADMLLRHDADTPSKLVYADPTIEPTVFPAVEATPNPTPTPTVPVGTTPDSTKVPSKDTNNQTDGSAEGQLTANTTPVSLDTIYGYENVTFNVSDYKSYDSYPENASAYCITAKSGYKVCVITMEAQNTGEKAVALDMAKKNVTYHLNSGGKWYSSMQTIMENDAQYLEEKLKAGKKKDIIIVFELEESVDIKDATLVFLQGTNSCEVKLD